MTRDELKERLIEVKKFAQAGLDSLANEDFQKFDIRVNQVEEKLKVAAEALKEHKENLAVSKDLDAVK